MIKVFIAFLIHLALKTNTATTQNLFIPCLELCWSFYQTTFVYSHFSPKIQFLYCFLSSIALSGNPVVDTEESFLKFRSAESWKPFFLDFSRNFRVLWAVLKKSWPKRYIQLYFMCVYKYLNLIVRSWIEWKTFQECFKNKKKKAIRDWSSKLNSRLSFYYHLPVVEKLVKMSDATYIYKIILHCLC